MKRSELISLIVTPIVTGGISFVASLTLIITVLRSNLKLSNIYRRFVFGLSVFDVLQSLSQAISSITMPSWTKVWLAIGNNTSCDISAFLAVVGSCGAMLYSLSLTIYFMLVIKYNMTDAKITEKYEKLLHALPIMYTFTVAIAIYATGNYNPAGPVCWINSEPLNCRDDPNVECTSWGNPDIFKWISGGGPAISVLFFNSIILCFIWRTMNQQVQKSESYRYSWMEPTSQSITNIDDPEEQINPTGGEDAPKKFKFCSWIKSCAKFKRSKEEADHAMSPLAARLSRPSKASVRLLKEISHRAVAYIIGYFLTYIFTFIYRVIEMAGAEVPFPIIFLSRFFYPLQGLFNVLIYTYPHVKSYLRNHEGTSWIGALWAVIKSGGDSDQAQKGSSPLQGKSARRESLRKQQKILAQSIRRNSLTGLTPKDTPGGGRRNSNGISTALQNLVQEEEEAGWTNHLLPRPRHLFHDHNKRKTSFEDNMMVKGLVHSAENDSDMVKKVSFSRESGPSLFSSQEPQHDDENNAVHKTEILNDDNDANATENIVNIDN